MDYLQLTSPCGLDCFNCVFHLATREDEPALRATRAYHERTGVPLEAIRCLGCLGLPGPTGASRPCTSTS